MKTDESKHFWYRRQLALFHTVLSFKNPEKKAIQKHYGKSRNAGKQHFLLFPPCFLPLPRTDFNFSVTFILLSADAFGLDKSKILLFGKELTLSQMTHLRPCQTQRVSRQQFQI